MAKEKTKYVLLVDDSGYNPQEDRGYQGTDKQSYEEPKGWVPLGPDNKYFVGVLVPEEELEAYLEDIKKLKMSLGLAQTEEMHSKDVYPIDPELFFEYMLGLVEIAQNHNVRIITPSSIADVKIKERFNELSNLIRQLNIGVSPTKVGEPKQGDQSDTDDEFTLSDLGTVKKNDANRERKLALISLYEAAQKEVGEDGVITQIYCDEEFGFNSGKEFQITDETKLTFLESTVREGDSLEVANAKILVQSADNFAWFYNRVNCVLPVKVIVNGDNFNPKDSDLMSLQLWNEMIRLGIYVGQVVGAISVYGDNKYTYKVTPLFDETVMENSIEKILKDGTLSFYEIMKKKDDPEMGD